MCFPGGQPTAQQNAPAVSADKIAARGPVVTPYGKPGDSTGPTPQSSSSDAPMPLGQGNTGLRM